MALIDATDLLILAGLAIMGVGIWLIYPPAALIFVGLLVAGLGIALS